MFRASIASILCGVALAQDTPAPELAAPTAATVRVGTVELHCTRRGEGPPVLLLSGGPGFANYLAPVAEGLAASHECILLDQRGTGRSQAAGADAKTLTLANAIADLEAVREQLHFEHWTLLGHSWGGMLAMAYACEHPERVQSMVLVGTGGPTLAFAAPFGDNLESRATAAERKQLAFWNDPANSKADPQRAIRERLRLRFPAYFFDHAAGETAWPEFGKCDYASAVFRALMADLRATDFDLRPRLPRVTAPTLLLQGRQDPLPESILCDLHKQLPSAELHFVERCGHFVWIEQPKAFFATVREWLSAHAERR